MPVNPRARRAQTRHRMSRYANQPMSTPTYQENVDAQLAMDRSAGLERLLAQFRPRLGERMPKDEFQAEGILALTFLFAAVPLAILAPQHGQHSVLLVALYLVVYAITTRVEFDLGSGYCIPTQIVLVPMLFALPAAWAPLLVAFAVMAGRLPSILRGERHPDRAIATFVDAWHAIGPAAVFAFAGVTGPHWSDWPLLVAALAAQF